MTKKYKALRVISWLYRILGLLAILGGILTFIASIVIRGSDVLSGVIALIGGLVGAVMLLGIGELFHLFIDIEENTRVTAAAVRQMAKKER